MDMTKEELRELIRQVVDENGSCQFDGCDAGYCQPRLMRLEDRLEYLIEGSRECLNSICDYLRTQC